MIKQILIPFAILVNYNPNLTINNTKQRDNFKFSYFVHFAEVNWDICVYISNNAASTEITDPIFVTKDKQKVSMVMLISSSFACHMIDNIPQQNAISDAIWSLQNPSFYNIPNRNAYICG